MKQNIKENHRNRKLILVFILALLACCALAFIGASSVTKAEAAGNTAIQSFYGTKKTSHVRMSGDATIYPNRTEQVSFNTGILIYSLTNTGKSSSTSTLLSDSNVFVIDFFNARDVYPGKETDRSYDFRISYSSGGTAWYAKQTVTSVTTGEGENALTTHTLHQDINGRKTTYTDAGIGVARIGKQTVTLPDGVYTVRSTYRDSYLSIKNIIKWGTYQATAGVGGTLTVDTQTPTSTLSSNGKPIASGSYVRERVVYNASDSNHGGIYYKTPTSTAYSYTTSRSYTSGTVNGWYYCYARDKVGHETPVSSFYYDNVLPSGRISSNGTVIASGSYIAKAFSYTATDAGGIQNLYYRTPTSGVFQQYSAGTIIPANAGDGWYYFYATDRSGNVSSTSSVYLETQAPLVEIYRNGTLAYSKSITAAGSYDTDIYLNTEDVLRISCDTSSGKVTCNYPLDQDIEIGSAYPLSEYKITITSATSIRSDFTYHIVRSKPHLIVDGKDYPDGSTLHLKSDTLIGWECDETIGNTGITGMSISSEGNVNLNEFLSYADGRAKTLTTADGTETKYIMTLNDRAGNQSTYTVYIDKRYPVGEWKSFGEPLGNGGYARYPLSFEFDEEGVTAQLSVDGGEYAAYTSGQEMRADGTYIVVLTDQAGNKSTFTAHIDTVPDVGQLYADYESVESGTVTNGKIYFSWDQDISATVNGVTYSKNSVLSADGEYLFVLRDFAGNESEYRITIDTVKPHENQDRLQADQTYTVGKWYVVEFGETRRFCASYEAAVDYTCSLETQNHVTALQLNDVNDFSQLHLIATNGNPADEIRTGTYWRYKSKANAENELYYFDESLLQEVITYYAKTRISAANYYDPNAEQTEVEYDSGMFDNIWTASDGTKAPCANKFSFEKSDSVRIFAELVGSGNGQTPFEFGIPFGEQFTTGGLYLITEVDEAGNECRYFVYLDTEASTLIVQAEVFGEEGAREIQITKDTVAGIKAYYYKTFAISGILDSDAWAIVKVENEGRIAYYSQGDEIPAFDVGGEYSVTVYDRLDNGYTFLVYIVGNEARIAFTPNEDNTAFVIDITLEQRFDTLVTLEIYKDGVKLNHVSTDVLRYTFEKDGYYTVTMRDNFGRIVEKHYDFEKSLPSGTLVGVEEGGRTTGTVELVFDHAKYVLQVFRVGEQIATDSSGSTVVSEDGKYELRLINLTDQENVRIYSFEIDTVAPEIELTGAENGKTVNGEVTVSWSADDLHSAVYTLNGGEEIRFENQTAFSSEGIYVISLTDDLGNNATAMFTIDKTLDYEILINNVESAGVDTTNKDVTVLNREPLLVTVNKNGEAFAYEFGMNLSDEGVYGFRISDDYGNTETFVIVIDKTVSYESNVTDGVITNENVTIVSSEKVTSIVTKDGNEYPYVIGEELNEEGNYKVVLYDAYGNGKTFSFQIVKGVKSSLDYKLGDHVEVVSVLKDGESVAHEGQNLAFDEDGTYIITCSAEGREFSFELSLDTTAPTVKLNGIENGSTGNVTVTLTDLSEEGEIDVFKDGIKITYNLGDELKDYGSYEIKVRDTLGNERVYGFTLAYQISGGLIALIVIAVLVVLGGVVFIVLKKKKVF